MPRYGSCPRLLSTWFYANRVACAQTGELIDNIPIHELNMQVTDLQWSPDRTYFITASKDKTAKLLAARDLELLKTYPADTPLNSACITPKKDYVILGGGQAAMDVTTTAARQGKFEARFYHKIFEDEIGRVRGHFGPLVSRFCSLDPARSMIKVKL